MSREIVSKISLSEKVDIDADSDRSRGRGSGMRAQLKPSCCLPLSP